MKRTAGITFARSTVILVLSIERQMCIKSISSIHVVSRLTTHFFLYVSAILLCLQIDRSYPLHSNCYINSRLLTLDLLFFCLDLFIAKAYALKKKMAWGLHGKEVKIDFLVLSDPLPTVDEKLRVAFFKIFPEVCCGSLEHDLLRWNSANVEQKRWQTTTTTQVVGLAQSLSRRPQVVTQVMTSLQKACKF